MLSVHPPHTPNLAPPEDMARHNPGTLQLRPNVPPVPRIDELARRELAGYYAQIENLDRNVGRVLQRLRERDLLDDTLVVFFSDHGDCMGSHGYIQHTQYKRLHDGLNLPWRGVVTKDGWKYVCIPNAPFGMWNLNEDPYEMANLAFNQRFIHKRKELQLRLQKWIEDTGDAFDLPPLPPEKTPS